MVDSVTANAGSGGPQFATDMDNNAVNWPYSKVAFGAGGTQTEVSAANPLPVSNPTALPLPSGAATAANQSTGNAALAAIETAVQGTLTTAVASLPALPEGSNAIGSVLVSNIPAIQATNEKYAFNSISASALIKTGAGALGGFLVASTSSSPTITIYDGVDNTGTKILDGMALTAATPYPVPVAFSTGCYVAISGTATLTVFYN